MKIELHLFAGIREQIGTDKMLMELPESATIATVRQQLSDDYPAIGPLLHHSRFAINHAYANEKSVIPIGATVACIPPVSGG